MFEYDEIKSQLNLKKHGIDFGSARVIWDDPDLIEIPARIQGEMRFMVIGRIGLKLWSAVITYRGSGVRIISVRRSRPEERVIYES